MSMLVPVHAFTDDDIDPPGSDEFVDAVVARA
jgi:hypothetical protein